jgi:capsular polysaccharide biosynthesis protein
VEEALISDNLNRQKMANISVIQAASVPQKPIKPKKALNVALGVILGVVSGLGLAFFSEYTNQGLSTPESAERHLGLPVLGMVPYKEEK